MMIRVKTIFFLSQKRIHGVLAQKFCNTSSSDVDTHCLEITGLETVYVKAFNRLFLFMNRTGNQ